MNRKELKTIIFYGPVLLTTNSSNFDKKTQEYLENEFKVAIKQFINK